jgi:ABC-type transport system substrate-binding protein
MPKQNIFCRKGGNTNTKRKGMAVILSMFGLSLFLAGGVPVRVAQEVAKGQVVIYGIPAADVQTIDPLGSMTIANMPNVHCIFSGLVRHPYGNAGTPEFEPDLATKWEVYQISLPGPFTSGKE